MTLESERLLGDVAIVTGAASGICRAIATKLALNGAVVACADIDDEGLDETVTRIEKQGGESFAVHMDISDSDQVAQGMADVFDREGKITILVNGAAIIAYDHLLEAEDDVWDRVLRVNLTGYFYCLREVFPYMMKNGGGRIVQISSSTGFSGSAFAGPAYTAAKAGIVGLTKYAAGIGAEHNIRANTICPGLTVTPIVTMEDGTIKDREEHEAAIPLGRLAEPEDQADVAMFLVSDESSYMTGMTLHVNGGKYMYYGT